MPRQRSSSLLALLLTLIAVTTLSEAAVSPRKDLPSNNSTCPDGTNAQMMEWFNKDADWEKARSYRTQLREYCTASPNDDGAASSAVGMSSVVCSDEHRYCEIKGLQIDFSKVADDRNGFVDSISMSLLGKCALSQAFSPSTYSRSPSAALATWGRELTRLTEAEQPEAVPCDITIDTPVMFTKSDSHANIYHGMCDFLNIHYSIFVRGWQDLSVEDLHVGYLEAPYPSAHGTRMSDIFKAFSSHPVIFSQNWKGKRVCLKDVVLSTLPRCGTSYFYNMPLTGARQGCTSGPTSLFPLFSKIVRERVLNNPIPVPSKDSNAIRLVLLSRNHGVGYTSGTRHVLNEAAVVSALKEKIPNLEIELAYFDWMDKQPFRHQIDVVAKADILAGMHGAGLTHLLWLPPWASVIELDNCGDDRCYADLAALQGVYYLTATTDKNERVFPKSMEGADKADKWESVKKNNKFYNYNLDIDNVVDVVSKAVQHVTTRRAQFALDKHDEL